MDEDDCYEKSAMMIVMKGSQMFMWKEKNRKEISSCRLHTHMHARLSKMKFLWATTKM
jgi:hypothetical protein